MSESNSRTGRSTTIRRLYLGTCTCTCTCTHLSMPTTNHQDQGTKSTYAHTCLCLPSSTGLHFSRGEEMRRRWYRSRPCRWPIGWRAHQQWHYGGAGARVWHRLAIGEGRWMCLVKRSRGTRRAQHVCVENVLAGTLLLGSRCICTSVAGLSML